MRATCFVWIALLALGCGHSGPPVAETARGAGHDLPAWQDPEGAAGFETDEDIGIAGLAATLGAVDVRQTMERRQEELLACLAARGRRRTPLHGEVRFAFVVQPDGAVRTVRIERSTIGHRGVERCLTLAALRTRFPMPQGAGEAELSWTMLVDDGGRHPRVLDGSRWRRATARRGRAALRRCEIDRGEAVQVTAHLTANGRVASVGGGASDGARYDLDCVLDEVRRWRMPRPGQPAKVTFLLR